MLKPVPQPRPTRSSILATACLLAAVAVAFGQSPSQPSPTPPSAPRLGSPQQGSPQQGSSQAGKLPRPYWPMLIHFEPFVPGSPAGPLDPAGYEVRLALLGNQDQELGFPCDELVEAPPGRYKYWLEGNGHISPHTSVLQISGRSSQGPPKTVTFPVVPAGTVALDRTLDLPPTTVLRLLHVDSHNRFGAPRQELSRRVLGDQRYEGVLMATGDVIAGLWDGQKERLVAITRPQAVSSGATTIVRPAAPATGADVVVVLERPDWVESLDEYTLTLDLSGPDEPQAREPDVLVTAANRVFGFWYSVDGRYVTLHVASDGAWLPEQEIVIRPHQVSSFRGALRRLPSLDVELDLPPPLDEEAAALLVNDPVSENPLLFADLQKGARRHHFDKAPAAELNVVAAVGAWRFEERVDLSDGYDRTVIIRPDVIEVRGIVYRGDEPHAASIRFDGASSNSESPVDVVAGADGEYSALLYRRGHYGLAVTLDDVKGAPWTDRVLIEHDTELDIHVSAATYRARVVDSETGTGIPNARVVCRNTWGDTQRVVSHVATTDRDGMADLYPPRAGTLELKATADSYLAAEQSVEVLSSDSDSHVIELALDPVGDGEPLVLVLTGGRPAYDAKIKIRTGPDASGPAWSGQCDHRGMVTVPALADNQLLLISHPEAAFMTRRWQSRGSGSPVTTWQLTPRTGALQLQVVDVSGQPAPWANLAFSVDGTWLTGWSLAFLSQVGYPVADGTGHWFSAAFPASPIRVVAWPRGSSWPSLSELESYATRIDPPFAGRTITVQTYK